MPTQIINPQLDKFLNTVARPMSDRMVGLLVATEIETVTWVETILPILAPYADDDVIFQDENDSRTPITKKDLVDFIKVMGQLKRLQQGLSVAANASGDQTATISKPHVNVILP